MNCNFQSMKENLISTMLHMEKQKIGHSESYCIQFNTPEYYCPFEQLYQANTEAFIYALSDLNDVSDVEHQGSNTDQNAEIRTYSGRILVHALRLRLYFGIRVSEIPDFLKKLFVYSFKLNNSDDCFISMNGFWLERECLDLLESLSVDSNSPKKQLYYNGISLQHISFENFITLQEVTDIHSAILYQECYRYKYVTVCPTYIKQAIKASYLCDYIVNPIGWKDYFYKHSSNSIQKDVSLFRIIGFDKIPSLMGEILKVMEAKNFASSKEKLRFCDRLISKFHDNIQICLKEETPTVIDRFLRDHIV